MCRRVCFFFLPGSYPQPKRSTAIRACLPAFHLYFTGCPHPRVITRINVFFCTEIYYFVLGSYGNDNNISRAAGNMKRDYIIFMRLRGATIYPFGRLTKNIVFFALHLLLELLIYLYSEQKEKKFSSDTGFAMIH